MADPEEAGEEYADVLGVITALERTCELESRLRQCIQDTHPLTTTLDWDFEAADREREGLLAIRCAGVRRPGGAPPPRATSTAAASMRLRRRVQLSSSVPCPHPSRRLCLGLLPTAAEPS